LESKICQSCGRAFDFRKKWAKVWAEVKYCSDACRLRKGRLDDRDAILELLKARPRTATICPSEILPPAEKSDRERMEQVRRSARLLAAERRIDILQKGRVVDPSEFRGPIRLRLRSAD
jgi:hypothetical protein